MRYLVTLIRDHQVTLSIEAPSRLEVIRLVNNLALKYDAIDGKQTKIVSVTDETTANPVRDIPT
jgi:hypothetical protein